MSLNAQYHVWSVFLYYCAAFNALGEWVSLQSIGCSGLLFSFLFLQWAHALHVTDSKIVKAMDGNAVSCESEQDKFNRGFRFNFIELTNMLSGQVLLKSQTRVDFCRGEAGWRAIDPWNEFSFPRRFMNEDGEFVTRTVRGYPSQLRLVAYAIDSDNKELARIEMSRGLYQEQIFVFYLADLFKESELEKIDEFPTTVRMKLFYRGIYRYTSSHGYEVGPILQNSEAYYLVMTVDKKAGQLQITHVERSLKESL